MSVKKGLGRGFESLIPTDLFDESFDSTAGDDHRVSELRHVKLSEILTDPNQPRKHFDDAALEELTQSVKVHGILQPIVVTPHKGKYQIVAGERRFRASTLAGLANIPVLVRTLSDQHKLELALIENIQRRDLNSLETATAYAKLRDQFNMTLEEVGKAVGGKSVSAISNTLRLLRLPKMVQEAIVKGDITEGQARPLIDFDETIVEALLPRIISEHWSARMIEREIRDKKTAIGTNKVSKLKVYETEKAELSAQYKTPVRITSSARGNGQIVIPFKTNDEFEALKKKLLG